MLPDVEKYRHYVDRYDLNETQKTELIHIVHRMMENGVDRAFGDDPVQLALADASTKHAPRFANMIELDKNEYRMSKLTRTFNNTKGSNSQ